MDCSLKSSPVVQLSSRTGLATETHSIKEPHPYRVGLANGNALWDIRTIERRISILFYARDHVIPVRYSFVSASDFLPLFQTYFVPITFVKCYIKPNFRLPLRNKENCFWCLELLCPFSGNRYPNLMDSRVKSTKNLLRKVGR